MENIWILNTFLRVLEMVSGLKVNFSNTCLMVVNVP